MCNLRLGALGLRPGAMDLGPGTWGVGPRLQESFDPNKGFPL